MHQNRLQLKVEEIEAIVMVEIGYVLKNIGTIKRCEIERRLEGLYETIKRY